MKLRSILQCNSYPQTYQRRKGEEANFLAKPHVLNMYSIHIRDCGEISTDDAAVGMRCTVSIKPRKILEDKVRRSVYVRQKVNFSPSLRVWGWSRKGLRFIYGKGDSFPSHLSLESCMPLQPEYRTAWIRTWTMKALAEDHKDFTYLQTRGESWGGLLDCVTV